MKTYKELRDNFFEEVGKIDISKLGLGYLGLPSYAELLKKMSELPEDTNTPWLNSCCCELKSMETPKKSNEGGE